MTRKEDQPQIEVNAYEAKDEQTRQTEIMMRAWEELLPMIKFNWTIENLGVQETPKFMWSEDNVKWEFKDKVEYIDDWKYMGEWDPVLKKPHGFGLKLFNENKSVS